MTRATKDTQQKRKCSLHSDRGALKEANKDIKENSIKAPVICIQEEDAKSSAAKRSQRHKKVNI